MTVSGTQPLVEVSPELAELVGTRLLDRQGEVAKDAGYHLESILGIGGMGVAFLARIEPWSEQGLSPIDSSETTLSEVSRPGRPPPGARCVVKVLLPGVVQREARVAQLSFKKEVIALARIAEKVPPSPFVVRYLDAGLLPVRARKTKESEGGGDVLLPWCAVELVDGRPLGTTLEERLQSANGALEPQRAAALIEGIVRGVRAVHSVGIVHRDLKPSNVLVCGEPPSELPKITDFGVARAVGMGETFDVTVGTTGYCALEQLEGPRPNKKDTVGPWSDVFAIGAMIYEVLTRTPMYEAPSALAFVGRVLARNFVRLAERIDLGDAWTTPEGRALAGKWDEVLLRATSPRSPGGSSFAEGLTLPMRHRDVDELFDEIEPLLEATRALGTKRRLGTSGSVALVSEEAAAAERWEWTIGPRTDEPLTHAAVRSDGAVLASTRDRLVFWDGQGWNDLPTRKSDDTTAGILQGGSGTFVVVRTDGEVEVMPGGGGSFAFRMPFGVRRATALAGHPLGVAHIVVQAAHGEWMIVRMRGRAVTPHARFGSGVSLHALVRAPFGDEESLIVAGTTLDQRMPEPFVASVDRHGRSAALPAFSSGSVSSLAIDAEGTLIMGGPSGVGRVDLGRPSLMLDELPSLATTRAPAAIDALVALPDGQVWGFGGGSALRRGDGQRWRALRNERSLASARVLAAGASGARVWAVHEDGRLLGGRLAIGKS